MAKTNIWKLNENVAWQNEELKSELRSFNKLQFGNIMSKVADKRKELVEVQMAVLQGANRSDLMGRERLLSQELGDLMQVKKVIINRNQELIG